MKVVRVLLEPSFTIWLQRRRSAHICMILHTRTGCHFIDSFSLTMHNVHHLLSLMKSARHAIIQDRFPRFVHQFFAKYYGSRPVPAWAVDALKSVDIDLTQRNADPPEHAPVTTDPPTEPQKDVCT